MMNLGTQINTICICGAGTMGTGITLVSAMAGFTTIQFDVNSAMLQKSKNILIAQLSKMLAKGIIDASEKNNIINRITFTDSIDQCKAPLIIEAIIESKEAKVHLFNQLSNINQPDTILASNTSSIKISDIAANINNPERVVGLHFFNPAPIMQLVEIIKADKTTEIIVANVETVIKKMKKTPVICTDAPGFIVNRVARPYYLEALHLMETSNISAKTIDAIMANNGFKMGPFQLMDLIGIDINYAVSNIIWEALNKPDRLKPSSLQKEKINEGFLGQKTGKGFYTHPEYKK